MNDDNWKYGTGRDMAPQENQGRARNVYSDQRQLDRWIAPCSLGGEAIR